MDTSWDIYSQVLHNIEFNKSLGKPTKEELEKYINLKWVRAEKYDKLKGFAAEVYKEFIRNEWGFSKYQIEKIKRLMKTLEEGGE